MKKTIIMAGLLAATLSARAGVVNWTATAIRDPLGAQTITSVNMLYVELYYRAAGAIDATANGWETTFGSGGTLIKGGLVDSYNTPNNQGTVFDTGIGSAIWSEATAIANRDANGLASFYMKIYYAPTGVASLENYTYSGITHYNTINLGSITAGNVTVKFTGVSPNNHVEWTAVPEPATMALFGLGGLALIIRRKMRKEA